MVGASLHEHGASFRDRHGLALDLEDAAAFEHDVDLVVLVRLLAIRLGRHKHVDAELEARRFVDDLVAASGGYETFLDLRDAEAVHRGDPTRRR
jgi:hypothetical protein